MGKIFVATDTELKPLVSGNVNDGKWEEFTPYTTSGLTDVSIKRRVEGGLAHYIGSATLTSAVSDYLNVVITLYNNDGAFISGSVLCANSNNTGRPKAWLNGDTTVKTSITIVVGNQDGSATTATIFIDFWCNK